MKQKLKSYNPWLLVSTIIGFVYTLYMILYVFNVGVTGSGSIVSVLLLPHIIMVAFSVVVGGLACVRNDRKFALTAVGGYVLAIICMPIYFIFVVVEAVFAFIGFLKLAK